MGKNCVNENMERNCVHNSHLKCDYMGIINKKRKCTLAGKDINGINKIPVTLEIIEGKRYCILYNKCSYALKAAYFLDCENGLFIQITKGNAKDEFKLMNDKLSIIAKLFQRK